jgi:hypothetical protein
MYFINLHRLEQAVRRLARDRGFTGDTWAGHPRFGTLEDHMAIVELELDTRPRPRTTKERQFVHKIARAAVLGSEYQVSRWEAVS